MRLGVIDVGSNTVHLLVVDAHPGAHPRPDYSHSVTLRLAEHLTPEGDISSEGADILARFVTDCTEVAESRGVAELMGFATSAIRDAGNTEEVLAQVASRSGVDLQVLPGDDEARVTFLAARRWFGWSAGRLLLVDIGGGSLEMAVGLDEEPDVAVSLPLGAGRLTRELRGDPPDAAQLKDLRRRVRSEIATVQPTLARAGEPQLAVGTSKTIRSLARICGAAPRAEGPYAPRTLSREDLTDLVPRLSRMGAAERADLPGVSEARAPQLLAGAVVVEAALDLLGVDTLTICPWALREGLILRFLDGLPE
ncbi:Ppx/GppA phosphatase family protein [Ornithinimicrobium humiphilum]|uniref:Exopolyphosphatase/guanosine-5'-triphosphate, 3'-diphosphate pyrophosphatase n=1 Tax=Ornithinimicrobium humiphilum TaxID=125288 RepID=A0A543KKH6_9MICO|nr:Ppx/GppA phosphatase family protein [Ornithinimicrobium humiphilum]TQM95587.1 exopolyphosphatase/guanosine-5'-triphosphate,3'-diphosphate pyrophosphatase [Ornithinimicrobium humiphilum]